MFALLYRRNHNRRLNSTVALHWIVGKGTSQQFVVNRVEKIHAHPSICRRHVPTKNNPADIESTGGSVTLLWWLGPESIQDPAKWPENPVTQPSTKSNAEPKVVEEVVCVTKATTLKSDGFVALFESSTLHRTLRVFAWINRLICNIRCREKRYGPLGIEKIEMSQE